MKSHLTTLVLLLSLSSFGYAADGDTNVASGANSEISQEAEPYDLWKGHKLLSAEQQEQEVYQAKQAEIQSRIDSLSNEAAIKSTDAKMAHAAVENLRSQFLGAEKILKDPWREIYGEKKFAMSAGSSFVKFNGQILEVVSSGIRVFGQIDDSTKTEYFVVNFPYDFKAGESVDPTKIYMAFEDGTFSYVSEDGYAKTLPKLNYGKPCVRPDNAATIEQAAQQSQLSSAERTAKDVDEIATTAQKHLQAAIDEIAAVRKEAEEKMRLVIDQSLNYDRLYANKGNGDALRRMGERYRDGEGVETDTNKAAEYFKKSAEMFQTEANRTQANLYLKDQEALKQTFLKKLEWADKFDKPDCILYVEKCYRYGIGTKADSIKADEYHAKAVTLGVANPPPGRNSAY